MASGNSDEPVGFAKELEQALPAMHARRAKAKQKEMEDAITRMTAALHRQTSAYNNIIILAGYAGLFTVWNFTRDALPQMANITVALLISISLLTFVFFEVYKMFVTSQPQLLYSNLLKDPGDPNDFNERFEAIQLKVDRQAVRLVPLWVAVLCVTVSTALFASVLLLYNFVATLSGLPCWPT